MPPFPGFVGPSYTTQSVRAEDQQSLNWMAEKDELQQGKFDMVPTPGLKVFCNITGASSGRGLFEINGRTFSVSGNSFVELFANGTYIVRGALLGDGLQASITGNPQQLLIASAGQTYTFILGSNTFAKVQIPNGAAVTISRVGFSDGFFIALVANSAQWFVSKLEDATSWDPLNTTIVSVFPDHIVSLIIDHRDIWIFGRKVTTVYYDSGNVFPFDVLPSGTIEQGCIAMNTPCKLDNSVFWLGGDERGAGIVWKLQGYTPSRISTHAIEFAIQNYATMSDAIGYSYQDMGHAFYVLYFPTANKTWVYDVSTNMWHERAFFSGGTYTAHRSQNHVFAFGKHLVGDWNSGNIYDMDINWNDDFGNQIRRVRRAPYANNDNKWLKHVSLELNMETGVGDVPTFVPSTSPPTTSSIDVTYTLTATQVGANMNYTIVSNNPTYPLSSSVTIPVNPVPGGGPVDGQVPPWVIGQAFLLSNPNSTIGGSPPTGFMFNGLPVTPMVLLFWHVGVGGGIDGGIQVVTRVGGVGEQLLLYYLTGPQLYSGPESSPTMLAGTFTLHQSFPITIPGTSILIPGPPQEPQINLRWSDSNGKAWSNYYARGIGMTGEDKKRVIWRRLGRARRRLYEVSTSDPVPYRINDAYLDVQPGSGA